MERTQKRFRKRDAILTCLRGTTVHPGADWVYSRLKPEIPDLSLGTVYRNLTYFKDRGDIISLGVVNGVERFDGNTEPHVHFVCTGCGAVIDLPELAVPQELTQSAAMSAGGRVRSCNLSFTGTCRECITNNQEETQ